MILYLLSQTGATAFHLACLHNHEEFVTDALELDIYYRDVEDANGNTALHLACKGGHLNIVKILLECVKEFDKNHRYVNQRNQVGSLYDICLSEIYDLDVNN